MYVLVRDLLERKVIEGAKLLAGEKGLDHPVLWVNVMEILDAPDSLQSGELLVTTGFGLADETRYRDLIMQLKNRGICGLVIQVGYYLSAVPAYIVKDAAYYNLPVIEIPAKDTFSHIMRTLLASIGFEGGSRSDVDTVFLKDRAKMLADTFEPDAWDGQTETTLLFLLSVSSTNSALADYAGSLERLRTYFAACGNWVRLESTGEKGLYAVCLKKDRSRQDVFLELTDLLTQISRERHVNVLLGVSNLSEPGRMESAFEQALQANRAMQAIGVKKGVCHVDNIRFFEWFDAFHQKNNALSFAYDILKPVISHDHFHKSAYLKTLRAFLANDCKITETAEKLFIHRHTMKNRIDKISQLCALDFSDWFAKQQFTLALMVYDYFMS